MMRVLLARSLALALVVMVSGCGDDASVSKLPPPTPSYSVIDLGVVLLSPTNQDRTFDVTVDGGSALAILADGGAATDIDISSLRAPGGQQLVTSSRSDTNPLTGTVSPQGVGGSVATAIVPSSSQTPLEAGTYTFSIASFDGAGVPNSARVELTAIVNRRRDPVIGVLPLNIFLVGTPGLDASTAPTSRGLEKILEEVRLLYGAIGITVEPGRFTDIGGDKAIRLAVLDVLDATTDRLVPDVNLNRQSDEMDELFQASATTDDPSINLFLVESLFAAPDTIAVSGGDPGPVVRQGTAHSGVVAEILSDLDERPEEDLRALGREIAFAMARYLGVHPSPAQEAFTVEQAFVLLRNPAVGD